MAFDEKIWENDPSPDTPLSAEGLNDLEARIAAGFEVLAAPTLVEISGHSFTPGGGAYRPSQGYAEKVALALGAKRRDNRGWGGSISCWPTLGSTGDGGYPWHLQQIRRPGSVAAAGGYGADLRPRQAPYLPRSQVVIHHNAENDLAILGSQNPTPMQEAHRTIWSRYCASAIWEDVDAAWAYTGTWANNAQVIANSGDSIKYTTVLNDKATFTLPADYPGGLVVAVGIFLNELHDLTVGVKVDGVDRPDVRLNGNVMCDQSAAGKNMSVVLRFGHPLDPAGALSAGSHTIELTLKTQHTAGSLLGIDYAQIEADPADGPLIVVPSNFRPLDYSIWGGWPRGPNHGTDPMNDSKIPIWDDAIQDIFPEFGDRMLFVDIDTVLGKNPLNFSADNVHANERGHALVGEEIYRAIQASGMLTPRRIARPDVTHEPWFEPVGIAARTPFQNSWTNAGGAAPTAPLGFHRDLFGRVEIRGQVSKPSGAVNTIICQLPVGCWPSQARSFVIAEGDGTVGWGVINAQTNASPGAIYVISGGTISNMALDYTFLGGM